MRRFGFFKGINITSTPYELHVLLYFFAENLTYTNLCLISQMSWAFFFRAATMS